jgi:hypothetical protein
MQTHHSWAAVPTATYKATLSPERELLLSNFLWAEKSPDCHINMASSCSTSLLAPSYPMKIVPYDPRAPKPKPKSKSKPTSPANTTNHSRSGVGFSKNDGDWFHIDDFPMPDSNALRSLDPGVTALLGATDASDLLDHGITCPLIVASQ